jgi:hypothetical protein
MVRCDGQLTNWLKLLSTYCTDHVSEFFLASSLSLLFHVMSKLFSTGCHMVAADALPQTTQIQGHYNTTMFLFVATHPQPSVGSSWHNLFSTNFLIYPISSAGIFIASSWKFWDLLPKVLPRVFSRPSTLEVVGIYSPNTWCQWSCKQGMGDETN